MKLNPYLVFNGNCEEALNFYAETLGGQIVAMFKAGDSPMAANLPPEKHGLIMHGRLVAGDSVLMGSDAMRPGTEVASGYQISLHFDTPEETEKVYAALSEGGKVEMELQETFWAKRFAMFTDKFGIPWMLNCEKPMG